MWSFKGMFIWMEQLRSTRHAFASTEQSKGSSRRLRGGSWYNLKHPGGRWKDSQLCRWFDDVWQNGTAGEYYFLIYNATTETVLNLLDLIIEICLSYFKAPITWYLSTTYFHVFKGHLFISLFRKCWHKFSERISSNFCSLLPNPFTSSATTEDLFLWFLLCLLLL